MTALLVSLDLENICRNGGGSIYVSVFSPTRKMMMIVLAKYVSNIFRHEVLGKLNVKNNN